MRGALAGLVVLLWLVSLPAAPAKVAVPGDGEILTLARQKLQGRGDYVQHKIQRVGDKTVELEAFVAMEADFEEAAEILTDTKGYGRWALRGINEKADGSKYRIQVLSLDPYPQTQRGMVMLLHFDLPFFSRDLRCHVTVVPQKGKDVFSISADIDPNVKGTYIERAEAELRLFPQPGAPRRVWVYTKGAVKLKHWLLYEALPDRLIQREAGDRIQILVDNYQREEDRYRATKTAATPAKESVTGGGGGAKLPSRHPVPAAPATN